MASKPPPCLPGCVDISDDHGDMGPASKSGSSKQFHDIGEELRTRLASIESTLQSLAEHVGSSPIFPMPQDSILPPPPPEENDGEDRPGLARTTLEDVLVNQDAELDINVTAVVCKRIDGWKSHQKERGFFQRAGDMMRSITVIEFVSAKREETIHNYNEGPVTTLQWCVNSMPFEITSSSLIMLYAMFMGFSASTDYKSNAGWRDSSTDFLFFVESTFCCLFSVELIMRIVADRMIFFVGEAWAWNWLDFCLVVFSVADILAHGSEGNGTTVTLGRLLRLTRFMRLWRVTRVMKHFSHLRVILFAIMGSLGQLAWCFVLLEFISYVMAVMFLNGAADYLKENSGNPADPTVIMLKTTYTTVSDVMFDLFMAISGGLDWKEVYDHWYAISHFYGSMFIFYIFFMLVGVLNVIMASFVATTAQIAAQDREQYIKTEIQKMDEYMKRVRVFFKEADVDGSGTLSWEEFESYISTTRVKAYFQALDLDVSQAHSLFEMLDVDGSNSVVIDEFIDGCVRLRGGARSVDLNMILLHAKKLNENVRQLHSKLQQQLNQTTEIVGKLQGRTSPTVSRAVSPQPANDQLHMTRRTCWGNRREGSTSTRHNISPAMP